MKKSLSLPIEFPVLNLSLVKHVLYDVEKLIGSLRRTMKVGM